MARFSSTPGFTIASYLLLGSVFLAAAGCAKPEEDKTPQTTPDTPTLTDPYKSDDFRHYQAQEPIDIFAIEMDPDSVCIYLQAIINKKSLHPVLKAELEQDGEGTHCILLNTQNFKSIRVRYEDISAEKIRNLFNEVLGEDKTRELFYKDPEALTP